MVGDPHPAVLANRDDRAVVKRDLRLAARGDNGVSLMNRRLGEQWLLVPADIPEHCASNSEYRADDHICRAGRTRLANTRPHNKNTEPSTATLAHGHFSSVQSFLIRWLHRIGALAVIASTTGPVLSSNLRATRAPWRRSPPSATSLPADDQSPESCSCQESS